MIEREVVSLWGRNGWCPLPGHPNRCRGSKIKTQKIEEKRTLDHHKLVE